MRLVGADPEAMALTDLGASRTFGELEHDVPAIAALLSRELGLVQGEHVAVLARNGIEVVELILGALCAGLWVTPVSYHLAPDEVRYVVVDSGARVLFVCDEEAANAPSEGVRVVRLGALVERARVVDAHPLDPDAPAGGVMIYTGGTSGRPKGVRRARPATLGAMFEGFRSTGRLFGLDGEGPHLVTGPLYHAAPLLFALYDMANGATMIVMPRFDAARALAIMTAHRVRHAHFVPTMLVRLLRLPEGERAAFDPSRLTRVLHGAAPIAKEIKRAMIAWWGPRLAEYWGATEGGIYTLVEADTWLERPGTVGRAIAAFEIYAVDDRRERLPAGEHGMLVCRHRTLERPFTYHHDDAKTEEAYLAPHVFTVGDLGHVDEDGFVYLSDRRSNLILSGGVNIYPAEIERVLVEHPAVADVCVIGVPDAEWGETVCAVVELSGAEPTDETRASLVAHARASLAGYKVPRTIVFAKLPRTPAGKIRVADVRATFRSASLTA